MLDELNIDAAMFSATYKAGRNNTYECFNLQKHNTTLIELDFSFEQRKTELTKIFMRNHSKQMIAEIERLNA